MQELVTLVSPLGDPIGEREKQVVHGGAGQTDLHRGFSLFVVNSQGQHLLQQRSQRKQVWPGAWSNACCGHPAPGETLEDAACRRVAFELGVAIDPSKVRLLVNYYRYRTVHQGIEEHEVCPVLCAQLDATPVPNPDEVAAVRWVSFTQLQQALAENPQAFSPWMQEELAILALLRHPFFEA